MWLDVSDLRRFYESPLGKLVQRLLIREFHNIWPSLTGQRVLAVGYGVPYIARFGDDTDRSLLAMPAGQGVIRWPSHQPSRVVLTDERELPFPDSAFDRVLLIHAVEFTENLRPMLRETWRVLSGGGRLLVVVPNRRGVWARMEGTPFGHGQPYSQGQLDLLLRDCLFMPVSSDSALYAPPSSRRLIRRLSPTWEQVGKRWLRPFSGVVLMEAEKQVYAGTAQTASARTLKRRLRPLLGRLTYPATNSSVVLDTPAVNRKTP